MQHTKSSYKEGVTCETQLMALGGTSRCVIHAKRWFLFLICMSVSFTSLCQTRQFEILPPRSSSGSESCGKEVRVMMTQVSNFSSGLSVAGFSRNPPPPPRDSPAPHTMRAVHMIARTHCAVLLLAVWTRFCAAFGRQCVPLSLQLRLHLGPKRGSSARIMLLCDSVSAVTNEDETGDQILELFWTLLSFRLNNILWCSLAKTFLKNLLLFF